jgi:hypothetical protein
VVKDCCVANLKKQKSFGTASAFNALVVDIEWTLHLIGEEYRDGYLKEIQDYIKENLESFVFVYGAKSDIKILSQATIRLASTAEGFQLVC